MCLKWKYFVYVIILPIIRKWFMYLTIFSSRDPKGSCESFVRYCHHFVCVFVVWKLLHFNLLLWNQLANWNQTWQECWLNFWFFFCSSEINKRNKLKRPKSVKKYFFLLFFCMWRVKVSTNLNEVFFLCVPYKILFK